MRVLTAGIPSLAVVLIAGTQCSTASAQPLGMGRAAVEAVLSVATSSHEADDPLVVMDVASTIRVTDELDIIVRPYARRLPGGDWDALFYQAQIRYQIAEGMRLDAGIITSPIGLGTLELRPDLNPTVNYPFYYFARLPAFDQYSNRVQILSGGYPIGALLSASGARWDARAGVTDSTPARYRKIFAETAPSAMAQFVAGGGFTPWPGFRVGAALAQGKYRNASDTEYYGISGYGNTLTDASVLVLNLEAEWSYRHTRISGEWVRDRFSTDATPALSRGFFLQGVQTLTPRTFAAARLTRATTPVRVAGIAQRWTRTEAEITGGYRLTPEFTLRAGYQAERRFGISEWEHSAVASIVWARRWF